MGDVKLALLLGAVLGASVSAALMLGLFAALVPAVVLVSRHGVAARKMGVPLVPFLSLGSVVALFLGEWILNGYLGLF
jgi:prepilin signal peptidase PulO-like enzyme (type II secretory pathway)